MMQQESLDQYLARLRARDRQWRDSHTIPKHCKVCKMNFMCEDSPNEHQCSMCESDSLLIKGTHPDGGKRMMHCCGCGLGRIVPVDNEQQQRCRCCIMHHRLDEGQFPWGGPVADKSPTTVEVWV